MTINKQGWLLGAVAVAATGAASWSVSRWQIGRLERQDAALRYGAIAPAPADPIPAPPPLAVGPTTAPIVAALPTTEPAPAPEVAVNIPPPQLEAPPPELAGPAEPPPTPRQTLLDPRAALDERRRAVAQLAQTEEGAAELLSLSDEGRLSDELRGLAVDLLLQKSATLASGGR